ncbi:MAG: alpha/beta hydrolase [Steroidobacteraceae bacterium]
MTQTRPADQPKPQRLAVDFVTAPDGLPICVAETGNPTGPAILLIHGFSQTYAVFKRQFESDLARDFRLVAMDTRGHGCTGKPLTADAYLDSKLWADDIAAVIAAKRLVRPVLVGWSAGGYWIADYVRHYGTDNVAGSVLAGSHGGMLPRPTDPASVERMRAMVAASANFSPDVEQAIAGGDAFVNVMGATPLPDDIRRIMHAGTLMLPAYARRLMSGRDMQHEDVITKFRSPVLFIIGDRDRIATPEQLRGLTCNSPARAFPCTGADRTLDVRGTAGALQCRAARLRRGCAGGSRTLSPARAASPQRPVRTRLEHAGPGQGSQPAL